MPGTTPVLGMPYPLDTDARGAGAGTIQDLAQKTEDELLERDATDAGLSSDIAALDTRVDSLEAGTASGDVYLGHNAAVDWTINSAEAWAYGPMVWVRVKATRINSTIASVGANGTEICRVQLAAGRVPGAPGIFALASENVEVASFTAFYDAVNSPGFVSVRLAGMQEGDQWEPGKIAACSGWFHT